MQKVDKFASKYFFLIPLLVLVVYANSLGNGFVLDDPSQISNNVNVTSFNLTRIFLGSSFGMGGGTVGVYYKPLMSVSYALLYNIFGSGAWSFHLLQVLLQGANSLLVFFIFKRVFGGIDSGQARMTGQDKSHGFSIRELIFDRSKSKSRMTGGGGVGLAFWLALVFAVHPLNSESVLYISALQDPLFFFFGSLALLVLGSNPSRTQGYTLKSRSNLVFLKAVLCGFLVLLAMLSKETGVVFIPLIVLYTVFFNFEKKQRWGASWLFVVLGVVFAFYFLLRLAAVGLPVSQDNPYPIMRLDLVQRLINLPEEVFYYLRNFFYPHDFAVAQHWVVKAVDWQYFWKPLIWDALFLGMIGAIGVVVWKVRKYAEHNAELRGRAKTRLNPDSPSHTGSNPSRTQGYTLKN